MSKYLQKKFALSGQGGKDLTKAIFCCALTNFSLMFPMGILFLFMERLTGPLVGLEAPDMGIGGYADGIMARSRKCTPRSDGVVDPTTSFVGVLLA